MLTMISGMDEWRSIPGFPEFYQVSNLGEIRSLTRVCLMKNGVSRKQSGRILKLQNMPTGHRYITGWSQETDSHFHVLVHRAVALAFLPNPENLPVVNHKDGNPGNNKLSNLEWATHQGNSIHSWHVLNRTTPPLQGEDNGIHILTEDNVRYIRSNPKEGRRQLAALFNVAVVTIDAVRYRRTWKHVA